MLFWADSEKHGDGLQIFKINLNLSAARAGSGFLCWSCLVLWLTSDCDFCVPRASTPSPRRVSSSRSASGSPEPAAKKHPGAASPARSRSPSANWSPAKKAKSPSQSPSPARVFVHQAALLWFLGQALVGEVELLSGPRVIHRGKISHSSWLKICNKLFQA